MVTESFSKIESIDSWRIVENNVTFDGGTVDGIGDIDGANNPYTLFTVSGSVAVRIIGLCSTDLAGATATVQVGTAKDDDLFIVSTTATDVDAGETWVDATPAFNKSVSDATEYIVAAGEDIILTAATADVTGGVVKIVALWRPISSDGDIQVG